MALKSKITDKAEFDKLPDVIKAEYKEENGAYLLQSDEAAELRNALTREKERADKLEQERRDAADAQKRKDDEAAAERQRLEEETNRKNKDITAIEKSWEAKVTAAVEAGNTAVAKLRGMLENILVDTEAERLANEISTVPALLKPVLKARLRAELDGDKPITRVLDAAGNASAMNLEDLRKEVVANKDFAAIIRAGNGSGGGAGGQQPGGGATKKITDMSEPERIAHHQAVGRDAYREQAKAEGLPVY